MKRITFICVYIALFAMFSNRAFAFDFSAVAPSGQTLYYNIINGAASVTYPNYYDYIHPYENYSEPTGNLTIPSNVTYNGTTYAVTSIDGYAFRNCTGLTHVTIPNSVTSIGQWAFASCRELNTVSIPNGVWYIGTYAFVNLRHIEYYGSATYNTDGYYSENIYWGANSMNGYTEGDFIYEDNSKATLLQYMGNNMTITIPSTVTAIGQKAFYFNEDITSVVIPSGVTSIGRKAFYGCGGLMTLTIPNGVSTIAEEAFTGVHHIEYHGNATYAATTTYWGAYSMNGYTEGDFVYEDNTKTALSQYIGTDTTVIIPNTVSIIGYLAFNQNTNITSVIIPAGVTTIGSSAFSNCGSLSFITIPVGVTMIGSHAFSGCTGLLSIDIPTTVTTIGEWAFSGCVFSSIIIPNNVTAISNYTFNSCHNLTSVTIGQGITTIGSGAFANCELLDSVKFLSSIPPYFYTNSFNNCSPNMVFYAPCGLQSTYQNTWGNSYPLAELRASYNIVLNVNNAQWGTASIQQQGGNNIACDSTAIIKALSNYGYHFGQWSDGDTSNPRVVKLMHDTSFTALFEKNYYSVVGSCDTVKGYVYGSDTVEYLDTVTLTAVPKYGYVFNQWSDGYYVNPRHIVALAKMTKVANFVPMPISISLSVDSSIHGMCYNQGATTYLGTAIIQAVANYGYHFVQWSDGVTDNPRYVTLTQDTSFVANFAKNTYSITINSNDTVMGVGNNIGEVEYLDSVLVIATSNYGYHFTQWNDGDTNNPRYVIVTRDSTFIAQFDYNQYSISIDAENNTYGTVGGAGSYNYLTEQPITATPNYGYHFSMWNDGDTNNPRTITLTQDTSFTAFFAPNQYTLTVTAMEHGTASGSGSYDYGDTVIIQAFPDEHFHFTRWNDGNTENPRQYRIEDNITLTAFFVIDTYTVVVVSSDIVRGMVEASGTDFVYGTPCTVTATAYTGYTFAGWSNGVTANPYTFAVISDVELTALFVEEGEEVYTVTVESADPTMGTVSGGGQALNGGTVTITAIPNEGYRFLTWNDGNTENPRTVTVMGNITYTAYFESTQGIGDIDATEIKIYSKGGRIVVQGAEGVEARVYDLTGREVVRPNQNGETPVLPSGVYLVKAGTLPARKVVVLR